MRDICELPAQESTASSRTLHYVKGPPIPSLAPSPRFITLGPDLQERLGESVQCQQAGISFGQTTRVTHVLGFASFLLHTL